MRFVIIRNAYVNVTVDEYLCETFLNFVTSFVKLINELLLRIVPNHR